MERPAKRTRQACDPCRRKKSRCPGERPVCSYCERLDQQCSYSDDGAAIRQSSNHPDQPSTPTQHHGAQPTQTTSLSQHETVQRLNNLENQLAEVLATLHAHDRLPRVVPTSHAPVNRQVLSSASLVLLPGTALPSPDFVKDAAGIYLTYCHCQPLPLFNPREFVQNVYARDEDVIFSILALTAPFIDPESIQDRRERMVSKFATAAASVTMQRVASGSIELSTLQSLCLLSLSEFYQGNTHRASTYSTLAMDLGQSAGLSWSCASRPETSLQEEQMRCFWSIVLLKRLHGNLLGAFRLNVDDSTISHYPPSCPRPPLNNGMSSPNSNRPPNDHKDKGIISYVIQLSEVWQRAASYTRRRRYSELHPPWSPKSEYAKILARQMEQEAHVPFSRHRFKPAHFEERSPQELHQHRDYWGPWLLNQMMYHSAICLINHPLLLSLRLRGFRVASIPEIWLQHTVDLVASHTQWVIHLINIVQEKSFVVSDPFLAQLAAIVATIYLQQSFSDDVDVQQTKRDNFATCLNFCEQIAQRWPLIQNLVAKLKRLDDIVSISYRDSATSRAQDKVYIDLTVFWEVLESSLISEDSDDNGLRFGASLTSAQHTTATAEELNTQLLPEPTRISATHTPQFTSSVRDTYGQQPPDPQALSSADFLSQNDEFTVLAQSYFAQGQDFVGNLDDWWALSQQG